ncbi:hypothetical protein [Kitasatospora sp. HPMI-4]|uniref:hypothetical protein n=1 Tax=Kitasatospora sp. HPMI-4 TaxID=3448443 RepID=UPI003F1E2F38
MHTATSLGMEVLVVAPDDPELLREARAVGAQQHWLLPATGPADPAGVAAVADRACAVLTRSAAPVVITAEPDSAALEAACLTEAAGRYDAAATRLLLDKGATRALAMETGVRVAPGAVWSSEAGRERGAEAVRRLGESSTAGVVVKGALAWAGQQQARVGTGAEALAAARELGRRYGTHVVVEEFVAGVECSLETVRFADGTCHATGWSVKGRTDDDRHPLHRPRVAPACAPPVRLLQAAEAMLAAANYQGIADFDLVCTDDGDVVVLECNPRTSWATLLHWTSRGFSSVDCALASGPPAGAAVPMLAAEFMLPDDESASAAVAAVAEAGGWVHPVVEGYRARGFVRAADADALAALAVSLERTGAISLVPHLQAAETARKLVAGFGDSSERKPVGVA